MCTGTLWAGLTSVKTPAMASGGTGKNNVTNNFNERRHLQTKLTFIMISKCKYFWHHFAVWHKLCLEFKYLIVIQSSGKTFIEEMWSCCVFPQHTRPIFVTYHVTVMWLFLVRDLKIFVSGINGVLWGKYSATFVNITNSFAICRCDSVWRHA